MNREELLFWIMCGPFVLFCIVTAFFERVFFNLPSDEETSIYWWLTSLEYEPNAHEIVTGCSIMAWVMLVGYPLLVWSS
jgi:hypothetical protein